MKKEIKEKEFETIKKAIESVLCLWQYDFIGAENEEGGKISMSKKTFFEMLKRELKDEH
ncbi:MAG: hypothetical protein ACOC5T_07135 [Elusimicrobiota bacterium]